MNTVAIEKTTASMQSIPPAFAQATAFGAAFERRLPEIQAVKDDELTRVTLDIQSAVAQVLGALPEIRALREAMDGLAPLDLTKVDGLEDYALALAEANSRYILATTPREDIVALNEAALKMREVLRKDAHAIAARGLIPKERLTPFRGLVGYKNVAFELVDWANLLAEYASASDGRLSLSELMEAKRLGERLVTAAGLREQAPPSVAEAAHLRQQALTLLVNAYDEVRRAISFLRWREGDVDTIAPSLYGRRKRDDASPGDAPATPAGSAPAGTAPAGGAEPAEAAPPIPEPIGPAPTGGAPSIREPADPNLPGPNPFE